MMDETGGGVVGDLSDGLNLRQGLFAGWSTTLEGSAIKDVLVNHDVQTCTVLQHGVVSLYEDGSLQEQHHVDSEITWLLYVTRLSKYAAFTSSTVKLLDKQFQCTYESPTPTRINSAVYNDCSGDVVTTGTGNIATWMFRQGGRVISPREPITTGFVKEDEVSKLHLEQVPGKAQKSFVVVGCGVKVHWLQDGLLMADLVELHSRPITSIFYFRPMRLLITAAEDGSIKVWDGLWRLCSTFVGHRGAVTCLVPYTHLPFIVSGALDGSIRVWNLETLDQVEKLKHKTPVMGLNAQPGSNTIISYSDHNLYSWTVHKFVVELISLGCTIKQLAHTTHPMIPWSIVATSDDAVVRLISPVKCHIITTALLPVTSSVVSVATAAHSKTLYILLDNGDIKVMDYSTNPCTLKDTWNTRLYGCDSKELLQGSILHADGHGIIVGYPAYPPTFIFDEAVYSL